MPRRSWANQARKKHSRKQKKLHFLEGMKKEEIVSEELELESPEVMSCSEVDIFLNAESTHSSDVTNSTLDIDIKQLCNISALLDQKTETKEHLDSVGVPSINTLEKRKNEFPSLKRVSKCKRTSSLNGAERRDFNWPKRNSSTSCLTTWLIAEDTPKAKRSRDEVTVWLDDASLLCQRVKKTKNVESLIEPLCSSTQPVMEMIETSRVLTPSNKLTRHNSALNNSFKNEKMSETDDSPPILRPKKRTKSVSAISTKMSEEMLKLAETPLSLQDTNVNKIPAKSVPILENPVITHISARSPERHSFSVPHLRLTDDNSHLPVLFTPTNAQNESSQKVKEHDKSETSTRLAIWRLLSLTGLGSQKLARCSSLLSVSKLTVLCFSICSEVIFWLELSMKCIRKVYSSVKCLVSSMDQLGKKLCLTCRMDNAQLEQHLSAIEKEVVKLQELLASRIINVETSPHLSVLKHIPTSQPACCPPPPPPPPPPIAVPGQGPTILKTVKRAGSLLSTRPMSLMAITVEDIHKVQLRKTPSALHGENCTPSVTQRGPLVSLEMLRSVKLHTSQSRHGSSEKNKGTAKFAFNSSRDAEIFSCILQNVDTNVRVQQNVVGESKSCPSEKNVNIAEENISQ